MTIPFLFINKQILFIQFLRFVMSDTHYTLNSYASPTIKNPKIPK